MDFKIILAEYVVENVPIWNAIPDSYIHEIRNYFNYTSGTLEITL